MKNNILALLWAFVFVPAFGQKTLPLSPQPYTTNWPSSIARSMQRAGLELPALPSKVTKSNVQSRSALLQLDSTKTFYGYGIPTPSDSTPIYRTTYFYPSADVKIEKESQYENGSWTNLNRSTYTSDAQGRLTEVFAEIYDPNAQGYQQDSRLEVFPHGDSPVLLDSFFVYSWNIETENWELIFFTTNVYDENDRLLESTSSFNYLGQPLLFKDLHFYDAIGDNTFIESFAIFDGLEIPSGIQELKYQNHLLTQVVAFAFDETGNFVPQNKITYSYTNFDKEEQVTSYTWSLDINDWVQTEVNTYSYDNAQRVSAKESILLNEDGTEARNRITYAYIEDENLALVATYLWDGTTFLLNERQYYYYKDAVSSSPEPVAAQPLNISPNPTSGLIQLNFQEPALIRIYNSQGKMLRTHTFQPNNALHVNDLPGGLYIVTAHSSSGVFTGRLVKD